VLRKNNSRLEKAVNYSASMSIKQEGVCNFKQEDNMIAKDFKKMR
jgi:hypothetical protein